MKVLISALVVFFGFFSVASADYHSCKYDADQRLQSCLRWAAENHASDASCYSYHRQEIRACSNASRLPTGEVQFQLAALTNALAEPPNYSPKNRNMTLRQADAEILGRRADSTAL